MKLKIEFSAEITEDIGDFTPSNIYTAVENKSILIGMLKEAVGENAEILIKNFDLTKIYD